MFVQLPKQNQALIFISPNWDGRCALCYASESLHAIHLQGHRSLITRPEQQSTKALKRCEGKRIYHHLGMMLQEYSKDQNRAGNAETILGARHDVNKCKRCVGERDRHMRPNGHIVRVDESFCAMFLSSWPPYVTKGFSSVLAFACSCRPPISNSFPYGVLVAEGMSASDSEIRSSGPRAELKQELDGSSPLIIFFF